MSFPCGPTSAVQALNERTEVGKLRSQYRKRHARKVIRGGLQVLKAHLRQGGELAWEWPRFNKAWRLPEVQDFLLTLRDEGRAFETLADGCMFGLKGKEGLIKKPWRFMSTKEDALRCLDFQCDGSHFHEPCLGTNAKNSAFYTPKLCAMAARSLLQDDGLIGGIVPAPPDQEVLNDLTPQELEHLMQSALKLHRLCGHPNARAMQKLLRARGASSKLLAAASQLNCPDCAESKTAEPLVKAALDKEEVLRRTLQMDSFFFRHASTVHHFLLMLDEASGYGVVKEIKSHPDDQSENLSTREVIAVLEESWVQYLVSFPGFVVMLKVLSVALSWILGVQNEASI